MWREMLEEEEEGETGKNVTYERRLNKHEK